MFSLTGASVPVLLAELRADYISELSVAKQEALLSTTLSFCQTDAHKAQLV
jgi:hypothetical protein